MKKEMSPWARIKREAPGVQQSYREKKKSRKWLIALAGVLAVIVRPSNPRKTSAVR